MVGMKQLTTSRVFVLVNRNPPDSALAEPVLATTGSWILWAALEVSSVRVAGAIAVSLMSAAPHAGRIHGEVVSVKFPVATIVGVWLGVRSTALALAVLKAIAVLSEMSAQALTTVRSVRPRVNIESSNN